jgi:hypothetical protein
MQSKMNIVQSLKNEQSRRSPSSNRRQFTISRRANTYPYNRNKINSENCYKCDQNNDYINILNARFERIESLVENLNKTVKATVKATALIQKSTSPSPSAFGSVNLSKMSVDELLCFSSQLGIRLFGNRDNEKKPKIELKDQNESKENKILKNLENEANSNDFQNVNSPSPATPAHKG